MRTPSLLLAAHLALLPSLSSAGLDRTAIAKKYFGNDAPWYLDRIPYFESSNHEITDVYYYRWQIFRAHQRDLGANGFISTEFLDDVSWQTDPWGSLNDATAFHLLEGRWFHDLRYKQDYATFMYSANSNPWQYSESMADAVWKGYLINGDADFSTSLLDAMQSVFEGWTSSNYDDSKNLYYIEPLADATEYTISSIDASGGIDGFTGGDSFRPSINSYQHANAKAIANLAALKGGLQSTVDKYNQTAADIKRAFQASLWNSTFEHFIDRYQVNNTYVTYWNFIRGRELVGYVPWAHDVPDDNTTYAQAWKHLLDATELEGPYGLRTVEPSYEYFMVQYRYQGTRRECQWNGPAWPYQTTQVLTGLGNLLDHYPSAKGVITSADFVKILAQYAQLHYNNGTLDIQEDYNAATGEIIVGLDRSPNYFHSGYIDVILSNFVGIRARADDYLEVNPLIDASAISYFRAENVLYHGHTLAVQWDITGSQYGTKGLVVEVDGGTTATKSSLERIILPLTRKAPPAVNRPIAKSVQLQSVSTYPVGSVSISDTDAEAIHDVIDGRIFFFQNYRNGWDTPAGNGSTLWYQIDFGNKTITSSAEIAFFADSNNTIAAPTPSLRVEVNHSGSWQEVPNAKYDAPLANGITSANWTSVATKQIRLVFKPQLGLQARLVEFKVF